MSNTKNKQYTNGEVTIVWQADKCIHSGNCVRGLPKVFKPNDRPWINVENASTQELKSQVDKCPSGALSYFMNGDTPKEESNSEGSVCKAELIENGPLIIHGALSIKGKEGTLEKSGPKTSLCRCGASSNKPFCDGSHRTIDFKS